MFSTREMVKAIDVSAHKSPLEFQKPTSSTHSVLPTHPIHLFPNELLQEIFFWHVWASFDTPVRLILVCQLWNSIASSYPRLWANIYYGNQFKSTQLENEEGLSYRMNGMVYCSDQESLNHAIAKTGNSKFELTICWNHMYKCKTAFEADKIDVTPFLTRCRLLRFLTSEAYEIFRPWMQGVKFAALEGFLYLPDSGYTHSFHTFFPPLVKMLHQGSPSLWNLLPAMELGSNLTSHPHYTLLPKLKRLSTWGLNTLFNDLTKGGSVIFGMLEEMVICQRTFIQRDQFALHQSPVLSVPSIPPVPLPTYIPMPSLRKVSLLDVRIDILPKDLYGQLSHLTLNCPSIWRPISNDTSIVTATFPVLTYLSINGRWYDIMDLDVPKLVTLLLLGNRLQTYKSECLQNATLLPENLYIDNTLSHSELCLFLQRHGKRLRGLYLTHVKQNDTISKELASALVGVKGEELICPLLQTIDILCPIFDKEQRKEVTRNRLQRVIEARSGVASLRRVRYGCYPLPRDSAEPLVFASRKWWNIEWDDLLRL